MTLFSLLLTVPLLLTQQVHSETTVENRNRPDFSTIRNFNKKGLQVTRFDSAAAAIDAHDGEIALFNGEYYLYGTSYNCGYEWGNKEAPFCGFKVYRSSDLVHWTDKGFLFDASTQIWQTRCNGSTYGCYRPHVIYNEKTKKYVLWINVYDNRVGFRVFTSDQPIGPFVEMQEPRLAVNNNAAVAGLNNGDHDTFVDEDGLAYIAYTDWRSGGAIVIEQLDENYTSGTGRFVDRVTPGNTEAPSLLKRDGIYYVLYSDPNCGYCSGTGTSYRNATSPMGPWSEGRSLTLNSCGGQPSFVSMLKTESEVIYLYGSDLWNNAAKNEAMANYYWAPLQFGTDGTILPIVCQDTVNLSIQPDTKEQTQPKNLDCSSGTIGFTSFADIGRNIQRSQAFVAGRSGLLTKLGFTTFQSRHPNAGLILELYLGNKTFQPTGKALYSTLIAADSIGWSPNEILVQPQIRVDSAVRYVLVVKSMTTTGAYGMEYNDLAAYPGGGACYSSNNGSSFLVEKNRTLMFRSFIESESTSLLLNKESESKLTPYPNPVRHFLKISLNCESSSSTLRILELSGKECYVNRITGRGEKNYVIDLSTYSSGLYLVHFSDGKHTQEITIIKS